MSPVRVSRLYRYPIKGVRAVRVESLELDEVGPVGDRRWMVVSPDGRSFLTQRDLPRMALVEAGPTPRGVRVTATGHGTLEVDEPPADARRLEVPIWNDTASGAVASDEAARWFTEVLGVPALLVRLPDDTVRAARPGREGFQGRVAFADDHPLHLVSEASVLDVDRRVPEGSPRIGVERFRPNLVVEGTEAWEEDAWRRVRVGRVELAVVLPRARCVVTTVDPNTGEKGPEPLATLSGFRREDGKVWVGQNAVHRAPGLLRVGDPVEVLERGTPRPRPDTEGARAPGLQKQFDASNSI